MTSEMIDRRGGGDLASLFTADLCAEVQRDFGAVLHVFPRIIQIPDYRGGIMWAGFHMSAAAM